MKQVLVDMHKNGEHWCGLKILPSGRDRFFANNMKPAVSFVELYVVDVELTQTVPTAIEALDHFLSESQHLGFRTIAILKIRYHENHHPTTAAQN